MKNLVFLKGPVMWEGPERPPHCCLLQELLRTFVNGGKNCLKVRKYCFMQALTAHGIASGVAETLSQVSKIL